MQKSPPPSPWFSFLVATDAELNRTQPEGRGKRCKEEGEEGGNERNFSTSNHSSATSKLCSSFSFSSLPWKLFFSSSVPRRASISLPGNGLYSTFFPEQKCTAGTNKSPFRWPFVLLWGLPFLLFQVLATVAPLRGQNHFWGFCTVTLFSSRGLPSPSCTKAGGTLVKANHQCHPHSIDKELCLAQGQGKGYSKNIAKLSMSK